MLQYLIIQLDDTSISYCHYENGKTERRLMALEDLKAGILFAMKENLMIQFVYPDYELPQEYKDAIDCIDHSDIVSSSCEDSALRDNADVVVFHDWARLDVCDSKDSCVYVLRTSKTDFFEKVSLLKPVLAKVKRLNIVITDVETFTEQDLETYKNALHLLLDEVEKLYVEGKTSQLNLLTDRMLLDKMNNCNAGWENVTLAPDGKFYVCPAFYLAGDDEGYGLGKAKFNIGDLQNGLDIKNPQLYKLDHAPLCRNCDAYQCKRCVWLNCKTTYEVNTPSHEQCVVAHLERNASRELLDRIRKHGTFLPQLDIKEIDYLDPFDVRNEW
ncbi:MAG: CXXX repeat peptide maturase [Paraprevotella sp.]|nr:CXXX repeat peptide maturase [Paraprevotella sp.]